MKISRCSSCDEDIVWMKTANDKLMPVDVDSVVEEDLTWVTHDGRPIPLFDQGEHLPHFATCEHADRHRR